MSDFITNAELRIEAERLCDENETLRQQLADVTESMGKVDERCAKLRVERDEWHRVAESKQDIIDHMRDATAENAKLRSKARHMYVCIQHASYDEYACESCPYDNENGACDFEKQLGELGIEL